MPAPRMVPHMTMAARATEALDAARAGIAADEVAATAIASGSWLMGFSYMDAFYHRRYGVWVPFKEVPLDRSPPGLARHWRGPGPLAAPSVRRRLAAPGIPRGLHPRAVRAHIEHPRGRPGAARRDPAPS